MTQKGVTFIDVLVGTSLVLIVFLGIFGAFQLGVKVVGQSRNKISATAVANMWIEKMRNLPYASVGTQSAVLPFVEGVLDSATTTVLNNIDYNVEIRVKYISDSADGTGVGDTCDLDYKRGEVLVSWSGQLEGEVKLVTDLAPKNKVQEVASCGAQPGGILSVSVFDALGVMVSSPLIELFDPDTEALVDSYAPSSGFHDFPLVSDSYKVVISKSGYSTERTYGTDEIATPEQPHPLVLEEALTEVSFSIDTLSSMTVESRGSQGAGYPPIHNVTFTLTGAKKIGTDADEDPVYKYSQNHTVNGPGMVNISNLEWDSYSFSIVTPGLDLMGFEVPPGTTTTQPVGLSPNTSITVRLILEAENSLLLSVQDIDTLEPIFSASTTLSNTGLSYEESQYTDEEGRAYFIPLEAALYNLEVGAPGYLPLLTSASVLGETTKTVKLQRIE